MVNIGNMMKQAQQLQKKMAEAQEKLNEIEVEGTSGGGLIKVTSTAKGTFKRISIDNSLLTSSEWTECGTRVFSFDNVENTWYGKYREF